VLEIMLMNFTFSLYEHNVAC